MRKSRALTPPITVASATPMKGSASLPTSVPASTTRRRTSRARGPATAICAQCSVTEASCTSSSGHRPCRQNSRCCIDLRGIRRRGRHHVTTGRKPRGGAVVHDEAVLAQHHAVAHLADREGREGVDVDAVEEGAGVAALHVDLAERRDVADPDRRRAPRSPRASPSAASRVSPGCGKHCARSQRPVSTKVRAAPPRPPWVGVRRVGRKSLPR